MFSALNFWEHNPFPIYVDGCELLMKTIAQSNNNLKRIISSSPIWYNGTDQVWKYESMNLLKQVSRFFFYSFPADRQEESLVVCSTT